MGLGTVSIDPMSVDFTNKAYETHDIQLSESAGGNYAVNVCFGRAV